MLGGGGLVERGVAAAGDHEAARVVELLALGDAAGRGGTDLAQLLVKVGTLRADRARRAAGELAEPAVRGCRSRGWRRGA